MKQQTIVPTLDDNERMKYIFSRKPDAVVYAKLDHTVLYVETDGERFVSADAWNTTVENLSDFMRLNGNEYSYVSPSSFALSMWRKRFYKGAYVLPASDYRAHLSHDALYGGRCEVFRYGKSYLYQYDMNSSYPYSATKLSFPDVKTMTYVEQPLIRNIADYEGVSIVVFSQDGYIPVLPLRLPERILYAVANNVSGSYTHTELRYALECGVTIHTIQKQYIAEKNLSRNPFIDFVDYCYDMRHKTGNKLYKQALNGLFGRLSTFGGSIIAFKAAKSARQLKETPRYLKEYYGVCVAGTVHSSNPASNVLWASMVLAHARSRLHRYLHNVSTSYCDTDCVFSDRHRTDLDVSTALGMFKMSEGEYDVRGAKQYRVRNDDGTVELKLRGVSRKHRSMSNFLAARYTQERLINDDGSTRPYSVDGEHNPDNPVVLAE